MAVIPTVIQGEIRKDPHNTNYTDLANLANQNELKINTNSSAINTKANQSDLDIEEASRISGDNALNSIKLDKTTYNAHIAGIADEHGSDDIENDSSVGDGNTGRISGVFENLQAQVNAIVAGGTELDPRLSQALVDVENVDWTSQGFKAELDAWFTRIKEAQDKITSHLNNNMPHEIKDLSTGKTYRYGEQISAQGKPQLIYEEVL